MADKDDIAIYKMSTSLTFMFYLACHDALDYGQKQIIKLYQEATKIKEKWSVGEVTTEEMLRYCEKNKIYPYQFIKSISNQQKLKLVGKSVTVNALKFIESAMLANMLFTTIVLNECFKVTQEEMQAVLDDVKDSIDSYTRRQPKCKYTYLNDKMVVDILKDEIKLDVDKGVILK